MWLCAALGSVSLPTSENGERRAQAGELHQPQSSWDTQTGLEWIVVFSDRVLAARSWVYFQLWRSTGANTAWLGIAVRSPGREAGSDEDGHASAGQILVEKKPLSQELTFQRKRNKHMLEQIYASFQTRWHKWDSKNRQKILFSEKVGGKPAS